MKKFWCGLKGHNKVRSTIKEDDGSLRGYSEVCGDCGKVLYVMVTDKLTEKDFKFLMLDVPK